MAILKNVEIWWVKCDPKRPEAAYGDGKPKWSCQIRTSDAAQRDEWKSHSIKVTPVEADGKIYYKASLRKPTTNKDGEASAAPEILNGAMDAIDPNTVGNGSVANIRIFEYDYQIKQGDKYVPKKGVMLMKMQVTKLIVYKAQAGDEFDVVETEVVDTTATDEEFDDVSF